MGHLFIVEYLLAQGLTSEDVRQGNHEALYNACEELHGVYKKSDCFAIIQALITHGHYTREEFIDLAISPEFIESLVFSDDILVASACKC